METGGGDALERPAPVLPEGLHGTLMINPPYGERIDVAGKAARPSAQDRDIIESYKLGVNSYIVKPVDFEQFSETARQLGYYWLLINKQPTD